jgi:hypothetical protein
MVVLAGAGYASYEQRNKEAGDATQERRNK